MSSPSKLCSSQPCKSMAVFKCRGCSKEFCPRHAPEHRNYLNQQLETIFHEHNQLQQIISDNDQQTNQPLIMDIQRWEENSIQKIRQVAEDLRREVGQSLQKQRESVSIALKSLSRRVNEAREHDDHTEIDLQLWMNTLKSLRDDVISNKTPTLVLHQDVQHPFVSKLILVSSQSKKLKSIDRFALAMGNVNIEDEGQMAIHGARERSDTFIYGENAYSRGQHKIRFVITKRDAKCLTSFGIISHKVPSNVFGWNSNDETVGITESPAARRRSAFSSATQSDLKGELILQLELTLDCDQRKLSYYNERTTAVREISVDVKVCPFPWRLYFYLFDIDDRIRLFPSTRSL